MKREAVLLAVITAFTPIMFAGESSSLDQNEAVARIFNKRISRREIEPSEELRQRDEKLYANQKWSDLAVQYRNDNLSALIWKPLMERFVREENIQATEKDLDAFADAMMAGISKMKELDEKLLKEKKDQLRQEGLTPEKKAELERVIKSIESSLARSDEERRKSFRDVGKTVVERWKVNQALYRIYGGKVIWQQAGIEPLDAYRQFLEDCEKRGDFEIFDKGLHEKFWAYYVTMKHTDVPKDKVDFTTPWWLKKKEQAGTEK
jgi:hypothetical protein